VEGVLVLKHDCECTKIIILLGFGSERILERKEPDKRGTKRLQEKNNSRK
jgi:hypothetical protein